MSKTVDVKQLAQLTNITVTSDEVETFSTQFAATLDTIKTLQELNTDNIEATPQVTNLKNVFRNDAVDKTRMFTQKEALMNAKKTHNGYFVVPAILK